MAINVMGTWKNIMGNTGTKASFREQGTPKPKIEIVFRNKGTQGKFCWEQGRMDPLPLPPLRGAHFKAYDRLSYKREDCLVYS